MRNAPPENERTETDVFDVALSVGSSDVAIAEDLDRYLTGRGLSTFTYTEAPGQVIGPELADSLRRIYGSARIVVFLVSSSWSTPHTEIELEAALRGTAGGAGVWLLRLDESPLPAALEGRAWWPREKSLDELARAIAGRLGRRGLARWQEGALALGTSLVLALAALALGFVDPTRRIDALAWTGALAPGIWGIAFRLVPDLRRRPTERIAIETPLERGWNRWAIPTRWMAIALALLLSAYALSERNEVVERLDTLGQARALLHGTYGELRQALNDGSTSAARVSVQRDAGSKEAFDDAVGRVAENSDALRGAVPTALDASALERASGVEELLDEVGRTLGTNIGHQVKVLTNPDSSPSRARIALGSLSNYNTFLADSMARLESAVRDLEAELGAVEDAHRSTWRGLVPASP